MRICLATALTVAATAAAAIPATACAAPVDAAQATATVLRVVDGDTVDVVDDARGRLRVRVLGIDTPETKGTEECWGRQATEFATATLMNRRVAVLGDASQDARDRYGRLGLRRDRPGRLLRSCRGRRGSTKLRFRQVSATATSGRDRRGRSVSARRWPRIVGPTLLWGDGRSGAVAVPPFPEVCVWGVGLGR